MLWLCSKVHRSNQTAPCEPSAQSAFPVGSRASSWPPRDLGSSTKMMSELWKPLVFRKKKSKLNDPKSFKIQDDPKSFKIRTWSNIHIGWCRGTPDFQNPHLVFFWALTYIIEIMKHSYEDSFWSHTQTQIRWYIVMMDHENLTA